MTKLKNWFITETMKKLNLKKEFLSVREISEALGVSRYVIYRLLEEGELKGYRLPRKWLVTRESLERFLEKANIRRETIAE